MTRITKEELYILAHEALSERIEQLQKQRQATKKYRSKKQNGSEAGPIKVKRCRQQKGEQNVRKK